MYRTRKLMYSGVLGKKVNEFNENWVAKISVEISVKIKCLFYRSNSFGCDVSK